MADYKYLKENNLFEAHMRFMKVVGEGYGYAPIEEADEDPMQQDPNAAPGGAPDAGMPPSDPMAGGGAPDAGMGGMPNDPNAAPGGAPADGGMGQDPMAGGAPDAGMPPMDDMGGDMPPMDEEPSEDDNVLDIDDLTDAEEKVNDKVNAVGQNLGKVDVKIEKLLGAIDKLQGMFDKNNQDIENLKKEFEKRNPTQTERLNLRSLDSYPFNVNPSGYWSDKADNSNYSVYSDNGEPTTKEYVITNNDVDDFSEREIADSFSIEDDLMNMDIKKIFGI